MKNIACDISPTQRHEGEVIPQGVSFCSSAKNHYVSIRSGDCWLWITIPWDAPDRNYMVEEYTKYKWTDRLWGYNSV